MTLHFVFKYKSRATALMALVCCLMPCDAESEPPKEKASKPTVEAMGAAKSAAPSIQAGLAWLTRQQTKKGSWTLQTQPNPGVFQSDVAATSLAIISFLRAGHSPNAGQYQREASDGLRFVVDQMQSDGDMCDGGTMYVQGIAALALCEAFARTKDNLSLIHI